MKPNNILKSALFNIPSYLFVSILAVTNISTPARAEIHNLGGEQQIAQFASPGNDNSDNEDREKTQLVQTANALISQGNLNDAEKNLRKLIKDYPDYAFGYYQLGNVLFRQGQKDEAIKEYQQAIHLNSNYALAYNAIGEVLASQEQWSQAASEYNQALKINPNYGEALANMAQALWAQGNQKDAIASLEKALKAFQAEDRPEKARQIQQILQKVKTSNNSPNLS